MQHAFRRAFRLPILTVLVALVLGLSFGQAAAREKLDLASYDPGTIVIDTAGRHLYLILSQDEAMRYRIAVGREGKQWFGRTSVRAKTKNPSWRPTPDMRAENPRLPAYVPPGPGNPLGVRAIYLDEGYLRIHGTNAPRSIGRAASSGCFRMHNADVIDLYERVKIGAPVVIR